MLINSSFIDFFHTHRKDIVYILKRFYSKKRNRDLTLKEAILEEKLFFKLKSQTYDLKNINIKNNFPKDIIHAFDLLESIIQDKELKIENQKYSQKYWELYKEGINTLDKNRGEKDYYFNNEILSSYSYTNLDSKKKFIE